MVRRNCPPDIEDVAEAYCLDRLDRETVQAFENHYLACPECAHVAAETGAFIAAFRQAHQPA